MLFDLVGMRNIAEFLFVRTKRSIELVSGGRGLVMSETVQSVRASLINCRLYNWTGHIILTAHTLHILYLENTG